MPKLRIVFMGTPDFASMILQAVSQWEGGEIAGVYTQPDRPAGRGNKLRPSPVKEMALSLSLPVFQPENFKSDEDVKTLAALAPDILCVAAYGLILPQKVLDIPRLFALNVHGSLLPRYRGAAPIQRAVMNGDAITGITIMKMEADLDSGPMLLQQATTIGSDETAGQVFDILARQGADLMVSALRMAAEGRAAFTPQNPSLATYAHKLTAQDQRIDWSLPSSSVHNIIRGLSPSPGARSTLILAGKDPLPLRIEPGIPLTQDAGGSPGTVACMSEHGLIVACGKGSYCVTRLRPAGKPTMSATDFRNGWLKGLAAPFGAFEIR